MPKRQLPQFGPIDKASGTKHLIIHVCMPKTNASNSSRIRSTAGRQRHPHKSMSSFEGDPSEYCNFIDAFDTIVANKLSDDKHKLFFLAKYTKGSAGLLVQGCQHMPRNEGYQRARDLLQQMFGQKFQIARHR
ncbi:uncharacterized protein LOC144744966 [Ciona intestinalis]